MNAFNELNAHNSTVIEWEGKILKTTQDPSVSDNGDQYTAPAIDAEGNGYILAWEVINEETTDESEACNWDSPVGITLVK